MYEVGDSIDPLDKDGNMTTSTVVKVCEDSGILLVKSGSLFHYKVIEDDMSPKGKFLCASISFNFISILMLILKFLVF